MARFKTVLENAIALRRSGRALRWQEVALVKAVLEANSPKRDPMATFLDKVLQRNKKYAGTDLKQASASVQRQQAHLREHALKHGQRRGEWRDWGFGGKLVKKGCNERRKAGAK